MLSRRHGPRRSRWERPLPEEESGTTSRWAPLLRGVSAVALLLVGAGVGYAVGSFAAPRPVRPLCTLLIDVDDVPGCANGCLQESGHGEYHAIQQANVLDLDPYLEGIGVSYVVDERRRERGILQAVYRYPSARKASRVVEELIAGDGELGADFGQWLAPEPMSLQGFDGVKLRWVTDLAEIQVYVGSRDDLVVLLQLGTFTFQAGYETFDEVLAAVLQHVDGALSAPPEGV